MLEEVDLETVSGGSEAKETLNKEQYAIYKNFKKKHKLVRDAAGIAGMILGTACTLSITMRTSRESVDRMKGAWKDEKYSDLVWEAGYYGSHLATSAAAGAGIGVLSTRLGGLIADKLIERDMKKDGYM